MSRLSYQDYYDAPFDTVSMDETVAVMAELIQPYYGKPKVIYLLHAMMPNWRVCVRFRLVRPDDTDMCGFVTVDDAEIIARRWGQRVQWLTKWKAPKYGAHTSISLS
jgi:hypothetical protein